MVAIPMMATAMAVSPVVPVATPVSSLTPVLSCWMPRPKVVAMPKTVASTARISIASPQRPWMRLPMRGWKAERMVSGSPLRKLK